MTDSTTLIFLHVPRSGGTTLQRILGRQYPAGTVYHIVGLNPEKSMEQLTSLPPSERERYRCIMGHMRFGLHTQLRQSCAYLTLLRDPVDRLISHYHYVLRRTDHYLHAQVASRSMTLQEYVASDLSPELHNWQTRAIAGVVEDRDDPSPAAMLELAEQHLERFVVAGITDLFDESLILLRRRLGWGRVYYAKRNVIADRPTPSEIPDSTVQLIKELNEADLQLCSLVRRRLAESIEAEGPSFHEELRRFRRLNRVYSTIWLPYEKLRMHPGARCLRSMLVGALGSRRG